MKYKNRTIKGFSLVELSISIIIIAILIIGIIAGRKIIDRSRLNKIVSFASYLDAATGAFEAKFLQLPGDFDNTTAFINSPDVGFNLINGNGNGVIEDSEASFRGTYFSHLAGANLIESSNYDVSNTSSSIYDDRELDIYKINVSINGQKMAVVKINKAYKFYAINSANNIVADANLVGIESTTNVLNNSSDVETDSGPLNVAYSDASNVSVASATSEVSLELYVNGVYEGEIHSQTFGTISGGANNFTGSAIIQIPTTFAGNNTTIEGSIIYNLLIAQGAISEVGNLFGLDAMNYGTLFVGDLGVKVVMLDTSRTSFDSSTLTFTAIVQADNHFAITSQF